MGVHQRLGRHDEHDRLPLGARVAGAAADRGSECAGLLVDGGAALGGLSLDVAADGSLLRPAAVVAVRVVLVLLADARQGGAGSGPASGRLLADRVEDLLGTRGAADDALDAAHQVVLADDALRQARRVAGEGRMAAAAVVVDGAPCLAVALLAVAEVVVFAGLVLVVAAFGPHPRCEACRRDGDGQDQGHPVAVNM